MNNKIKHLKWLRSVLFIIISITLVLVSIKVLSTSADKIWETSTNIESELPFITKEEYSNLELVYINSAKLSEVIDENLEKQSSTQDAYSVYTSITTDSIDITIKRTYKPIALYTKASLAKSSDGANPELYCRYLYTVLPFNTPITESRNSKLCREVTKSMQAGYITKFIQSDISYNLEDIILEQNRLILRFSNK